MVLVKKILKRINSSWGQQPINEAYLGHMIPNEHSDENLTGFDLRANRDLHFNEHFSIINTSLTTIPKMTWILFDIIKLDSIGHHKLFHKRSSVDICPPNSWLPPSQTC